MKYKKGIPIYLYRHTYNAVILQNIPSAQPRHIAGCAAVEPYLCILSVLITVFIKGLICFQVVIRLLISFRQLMNFLSISLKW